MRPRLIAATAAVMLLALTGCSGGIEINATSDRTPAASETMASTPVPTESETVAPLVAETPASSEGDAKFLEYVRSELLTDTQIPNATDAQLVDAGHAACEQLLAGTQPEDVRVIEGEQPSSSGYYMDSLTIRSGAEQFFCPETLG